MWINEVKERLKSHRDDFVEVDDFLRRLDSIPIFKVTEPSIAELDQYSVAKNSELLFGEGKVLMPFHEFWIELTHPKLGVMGMLVSSTEDTLLLVQSFSKPDNSMEEVRKEIILTEHIISYKMEPNLVSEYFAGTELEYGQLLTTLKILPEKDFKQFFAKKPPDPTPFLKVKRRPRYYIPCDLMQQCNVLLALEAKGNSQKPMENVNAFLELGFILPQRFLIWINDPITYMVECTTYKQKKNTVREVKWNERPTRNYYTILSKDRMKSVNVDFAKAHEHRTTRPHQRRGHFRTITGRMHKGHWIEYSKKDLINGKRWIDECFIGPAEWIHGNQKYRLVPKRGVSYQNIKEAK